MKKFVFITIILGLISLQATAQISSDKAKYGSIYSKLGVGVPVDLTSSSADGMGALGVSFDESNVAGLANPALWGDMACSGREGGGCLAVASGGFSMQKFNGTDYAGSASNTDISANPFQLQLPIKKNSIGISVAVAPLTRSNYRMLGRNTRYIGSGAQLDTLTSATENIGTGGINSIELGVGWRINNHISVGYAGSVVLASLNNNITTIFQDANIQTVEYSLQTSGTGFGNRFGALVTLPNVLKQRDYLRIGASASLPVTLQSERIQKTNEEVGSNSTETIVLRDGEGLGEGEMRLPMELTGGLTYQLNPRLSFTTEALYQGWSDFEYDFNTNLEHAKSLTDRYKVAFGIRYFPFVSGSNKFLSRFKYRAGVSYDTGHLKIDGQPIETMLFSAGLGIPSPGINSSSSIDISFQYGMRGTKAQNLVKESIWGVKLSINLAELVFGQPKLQ